MIGIIFSFVFVPIAFQDFLLITVVKREGGIQLIRKTCLPLRRLLLLAEELLAHLLRIISQNLARQMLLFLNKEGLQKLYLVVFVDDVIS